MIKIKVNEIFCSIQGEGARAGTINIFIRLSNCDLTCGFCDTEFESGKEFNLQELQEQLEAYQPVKNIIWTGGEPALQLTEEIVKYFKDLGYYQTIETNGNHKVPSNLDYVVVSPKVAEHVLERNFPNGVDELRYPWLGYKTDIPKPKVKANYYYLSPVFDSNIINTSNLNNAINLIKRNPEWRLSIQLHKLINIP